MTTVPRRWLRTESASAAPARQRLVCLPHAGGTAAAFAGWSDRLPEGTEVVAVQYPGRQDRIREAFVTDMADLVDEIVAALGALPPLPTTIFGHSMGSAVGYEIVLTTQDDTLATIDHLVVSARTTPQRRRGEPNHRLDDARLARAMAALGGTDDAVFDNERLWPVILPPIRSDLTLLDRHRPGHASSVRVPVTAFGGAADPTCQVDDLMAWRGLTTCGFALHMFPGGHHYVGEQPARVSAALSTLLTAGPNPTDEGAVPCRNR